MTALRRMRPRGKGSIVQVGSALAYRAIPLQAAYCGSKYAIRGFTDSLRVELMHDKIPINLCMVQLPAVNTPQFDWALTKMPKKAQPVPPIFQPEVVGRAVVFAAFNPRREIWLGGPTWQAILGNKIAPWLADWYLARTGYNSQMRDEPTGPNPPSNLFETVPGRQGAHGSFDQKASNSTATLWITENRGTLAAASAVVGALFVGLATRRRE
jgi:hypothetical protein